MLSKITGRKKKRILVVSDSHGYRQKLEDIIKKEYPFNYLIHCGDGVGDLLHVKIPEGTAVIGVTGNVDLDRGYDIARLETVVVNNRLIMVSHGDLFYVNRNYELILKKGKELGADVIFFGHTHKKLYLENRPVLFNPGPASKGAYGIVEIDKNILFSNRIL